MLGGGQSDLKKVIPLQNAINKLATDMIVASEYAGFRQRWATGIEIPDRPGDGAAARPREVAVGGVADVGGRGREREVRRVRRHDLNNYVTRSRCSCSTSPPRPRRRRTTCSARS
jgi:hypothetical protein